MEVRCLSASFGEAPSSSCRQDLSLCCKQKVCKLLTNQPLRGGERQRMCSVNIELCVNAAADQLWRTPKGRLALALLLSRQKERFCSSGDKDLSCKQQQQQQCWQSSAPTGSGLEFGTKRMLEEELGEGPHAGRYGDSKQHRNIRDDDFSAAEEKR